ncbi:hypothetical protein MSG28_000670 [Choristoneura fumiferana]|uniref:Uncharacterized protein n=1 Tax=Choristoneura fumiferana TaxID=7141 RepID=A0ACC0K1Y7_CHOFU|nr:hypothetical protein MSG28_000670 [Choristoneura fumiferana]
MTFERPVSAPPPPRPPPPDILEESSLLNNLQEIMQLCVPGAPGWRPPGSARAAARRAQRVACDAPSPCCYMRGHISRTIMLGAGSDTALDPRDADASRPASPAPVQMPSTSLAAETCSQDDIQPELDTEILALLGDAPKSDIQFGKPTHKDLASRWQDILEKGLLKDVKEKILDSYLIPENCSLLVAPTLNPEANLASRNAQGQTSALNGGRHRSDRRRRRVPGGDRPRASDSESEAPPPPVAEKGSIEKPEKLYTKIPTSDRQHNMIYLELSSYHMDSKI